MPLSTYFSLPSTFDDVLEASYFISYRKSPLLQLVRFLIFFNSVCLMWPLSLSLGQKKKITYFAQYRNEHQTTPIASNKLA